MAKDDTQGPKDKTDGSICLPCPWLDMYTYGSVKNPKCVECMKKEKQRLDKEQDG
jgi:hypothetical protein